MAEFKYECTHDGNLVVFRASGFAVFDQIKHLKSSLISEIEKLNGTDFKILFDLRGLSALDPRSVGAISEIDDYLCSGCTATKIATVMDSVIAKLQHMRVAFSGKGKEQFESGRSKVFTNVDEALVWLKK